MTVDRHPSPPRRWLFFLGAFLATLAVGGSWALATPLMGVPDEPAHVIRAAAAVRGESLSPRGANAADVVVPYYIAKSYDLPCFARRSWLSAACQEPMPSHPGAGFRIVTTAASNSPVYYLLVGIPTLAPPDRLVFYEMRMINVILCAVLAGLAFLAVADLSRRRWTIVAVAVALTPQGLFLAGGVNPNSIELFAVIALLLTLLSTTRSPSTTRLSVERSGSILLSLSLLVSTRSISMVWALLAVGLALALADPSRLKRVLRTPVYLCLICSSLVVGVLSLLWYSTASGIGSDPDNLGAGRSFAYGAGYMLQRTFDYWHGWIGLFGWLDTPAPDVTFLIWGAAALVLVGTASVLTRGRVRLTVLVAVAATVLVPAIIQGALVGQLGIIWQGRYNLAVNALLLIVAGFALDRRLPSAATARTVVRFALAVLAVAHLAAFVWNLKQNSVASSGTLVQLMLTPEWQPPLGRLVAMTAIVVALAGSWLAASAATGDLPRRRLPRSRIHDEVADARR